MIKLFGVEEYMNRMMAVLMVIVNFVKTIFARSLSDEEHDLEIGLKMVHNISNEIESLDKVFVFISENNKASAYEKDELLKHYVLIYRSLEILRVWFLRDSKSGIIKEVFKQEKVLEQRVRYLSSEAWRSILIHNNFYGADMDCLEDSPYLKKFNY